jgi:hypothetical protein
MPQYAANTDVSVDRSRAELERTLDRYGATEFLYGRNGSAVMVMFGMRGRRVRFVVPMPDSKAQEFTTYLRGGYRHNRTDKAAREQWEQACRQRWRALNLVVKAKLEAVEAGIGTFDEEFLAYLVVPGAEHTTVGQVAIPQLDAAGEGRPFSPLLPALEARPLHDREG